MSCLGQSSGLIQLWLHEYAQLPLTSPTRRCRVLGRGGIFAQKAFTAYSGRSGRAATDVIFVLVLWCDGCVASGPFSWPNQSTISAGISRLFAGPFLDSPTPCEQRHRVARGHFSPASTILLRIRHYSLVRSNKIRSISTYYVVQLEGQGPHVPKLTENSYA